MGRRGRRLCRQTYRAVRLRRTGAVFSFGFAFCRMPGGPTAPAGRPGVDRQNFVSNPQSFPDSWKFSDLRILRQLFYKKSLLL
jgi:hypothetical protein